MARLYPWHKLPQFWELASRKQEQTDPGTKDEAFLIKMTLIRRLMTNFKRTVRANCAVSVGSLLPLSIRALAPWLSGLGEREVGLWTEVCPLPSCWLEIKQTFLSTKLASLLAFEWWAAGPHFQFYFERKLSAWPRRGLHLGTGSRSWAVGGTRGGGGG